MDKAHEAQLRKLIAYWRRMTEIGKNESWARTADGLERQLNTTVIEKRIKNDNIQRLQRGKGNQATR